MLRIDGVLANALPQWIQESSLASSCTQIAQTALAGVKAGLEWASSFGWTATGVFVLVVLLRFGYTQWEKKNAWDELQLTEWLKIENSRFAKECAQKILDCYLKKTKDLDLSGKGLSTVPDSLGKLSHLTNLDLRNNTLSELPRLDELRNLEYLDLSSNQISGSFDARSFQKLESLDLTDNKNVSVTGVREGLQRLKSQNLWL